MTKQSLRVVYLTSFLTSLLIVDPIMAQNRIGPSFECDAANVAKQPVAQIICYSDELARLDLSYVIAYQALRHTLNDQGRRELTAEANALILSVTEQCNIPKFGALGRTPTSQEIACIKGRYELKQRTFLGRLSGDALEEAKLQPEEILTIQKTLQTKGLLPATATIDGVFGPMTRTAISTWQQSAGLPDTGFGSRSALTQLSGALRQAQPQAPVRQEQVQTLPPKPPAPNDSTTAAPKPAAAPTEVKSEDRDAIKRRITAEYRRREKTLLEKVANYTSFGKEGGGIW